MTEMTTATGHFDADGNEFVDGAKYLDRHGDTWRYLGGIGEFLHVKRVDETTPTADCHRWCEDAPSIARDFGPMTQVTEVAR